MASPLISVVVPAYNHAKMVGTALSSVVAQDHDSLELIVVDDCSTDGTAAAIESFLADEAVRRRFGTRVIFQRNARNVGAHASINYGLARASGSWLTILNSDDAFHPNRLSTLLAAARRDRARIAFSAVRMVDADLDDITNADPFAMRLHQSQMAIPVYPSVGFACLRQNVGISTGNLFFARDLWEEIGDLAALRYCHDWDFLLRAVLVTEPTYVSTPLYLYRLHPGNSFNSLAAIAEHEIEEVLCRYFAAVHCGRRSNPLAPSPEAWPGVFDFYLTRWGFWRFWHQAAARAVMGGIRSFRRPAPTPATEALAPGGEALVATTQTSYPRG